jgi:inorganic pyrophosphatase
MGGHGTNVIAGLAVGMKSTMLPVLVVCTAILLSFQLGKTSGLDFKGLPPTAWKTLGADANPGLPAGLFGTAVATMGMLSNLTYVLAMDVFGPIADNAAGIVEMSPECPASARETMDRLDAAGNTTKAFTKGFAVSSAGLACFLLFRAFLDIIEEGSNGRKVVVDIVAPEIFVGGLIGGATVFLFAGIAMDAVGETAQKVVVEVRRQFREVAGIATGEREPQYGVCVSIVSSAAIKKMIQPGMLVLAMPILVGKIFHAIGEATGDDLLGAKAITSYLVVSSMTAILVALFLNNSGGAWDNAKKLIESGSNGGKGSDAHKAAVTGDTVGDPCKDTAGPSLHVLMKLTATVVMVIGPLITMPTVAEVVTTTPPPPLAPR